MSRKYVKRKEKRKKKKSDLCLWITVRKNGLKKNNQESSADMHYYVDNIMI